MRKILLHGAVLTAAVFSLLGAGVSSASAAERESTVVNASQAVTANARPAPCGFYRSGSNARYNHCGPTFVEVHVDTWSGRGEWEFCAPPWSDTWLGSTASISWAYYTGRGC